jgi:hypothetical protein
MKMFKKNKTEKIELGFNLGGGPEGAWGGWLRGLLGVVRGTN